MDIIETKLEALTDIKLRSLYIEKRFMSHDPEETMLAENELAALQDRFCDENRDFITPPMARAIKKDFNPISLFHGQDNPVVSEICVDRAAAHKTTK